MHRHRQLHLWITDYDYLLLREQADEGKETMSAVVRRLIKLHRPEPFDAAQGGPCEEDAAIISPCASPVETPLPRDTSQYT
jgi:hypothetical protein